MGAFLDWMDRFASGLSAGGGRMAGVGNAWTGGRQKAQEQQEQEAMKQAIKEIDDYDKAIQTVGAVNPQKAFEMQQAERKRQQELSQAQFEQDYKQKMLELKSQELAQKDQKTTSMKDYEYFTGLTPEEQEQYLRLKKAGGTNIALTPYDREMQKLQAKQEANIIEQQRTGRQFVDVAGNLLNKLEQNKDLFTAYSPYSKKLGSLTGGSLGMTDEERKKRGEIVSLIKNLEQKLVANARASGQVGINTLAERQAALGPLNENGEAEELIGYVKGLIDINNELYNLGSMEQQDPLGIR